MEIKKNQVVALENYSKLFMLLGLTLSLFIVYLGLEHKSLDANSNMLNQTSLLNLDLENENIPITRPPEVTPPPQQPEAIMDKIEIVKNKKKVIETILKSTEIDERDAVIIKDNRLRNEIVEVIEKEEVVEDVAFAIIEEAPIFPGCSGSKEEKKECFSDRVTRHVVKYFNADLAQDLGLSSGKQKIYVIFSVDKNGNITNIMARAPHKSLEKEAIRVIELLPKMIPGKQRNRAVGVKYSLPITFNVE